ncbi:MAG: hypothetical protein ACOYN3_03770 [Acidimicrobiia bacterium]
MSDASMRDGDPESGSGIDIDAILNLLAPVAAFVSPYVDAFTASAPEARVHLMAAARELCVAAEVFFGALEEAAQSAVDAKDGAATPVDLTVVDTPPSAASA